MTESFGLSRQNPNGCLHFASLILKLDHFLIAQAQTFSRGWADQCCIVPGEACVRLWQLLQPAIVGKLSVVNMRVGAKDDVQSRLSGALCVGSAGRAVRVTDLGGRAVPATTPSCNDFLQNCSKAA